MRWVGKIRNLSPRTRVLFAALLCILLLLGTTARLIHTHADGNAHTDCALCLTAHGALQPSIPPCVQQAFVISIRVVATYAWPYRDRVLSFSHWSRPPPDQTANS